MPLKFILCQNSQTYSMSLERIRILIANFTLVGVHSMCSSLSSPSALTNQRTPFISQSMPSIHQSIIAGLFQRYLHLQIPRHFVFSSHSGVILDEKIQIY